MGRDRGLATVDAIVAGACVLVASCAIAASACIAEPTTSWAWLGTAIVLATVGAGAAAGWRGRREARAIDDVAAQLDALAAADDGADGVTAWDAFRAALPSSARDRRVDAVLGAPARRVAEHVARTAAAASAALALAEQETRGKMQFFGAISHDLRGPLASIVGFADLLEVDPAMTPEQRQSAHQIRSGATALLALVDDLLDAARLEVGRIVLRPRWSPVVELWSDATIASRHGMETRGIRVEVEMEAGLPPVWVDPARSRQALGLLVGALLPSFLMGKLVLRASVVRDPSAVPAAVRARGSGAGFVRIDLDDRNAALDAKLHAQQLATLVGALGGDKPEGSLGLRLSLAVALVEMQGGWAECTSRDDGSHVVSIGLPLEPPPGAAR